MYIHISVLGNGSSVITASDFPPVSLSCVSSLLNGGGHMLTLSNERYIMETTEHSLENIVFR